MKLLKSKAVTFAFILGLLGFGLLSCSSAGVLLQTAPSSPKGAPATPAIKTKSLAEWEAAREPIETAFETQVYGRLPRDYATELVSLKALNNHDYANTIIEERVLKTWQPVESAQSSRKEISYNTVIARPANSSGPVPVIMMESFCPNHDVVPINGVSTPNNDYFSCHGEGVFLKLFSYFFGRYIVTPPIEDIIARGYALAVIYPSDIYPDNAEAFNAARREAPSAAQPWGAIGAWAFMFSSLNEHLKSDETFSKSIAYGHSRYGKSALLAGAFNSEIDAVISHQSGTGGASLSRDKKGESVESIMREYAHWFSPQYSADNPDLDQHFLLALMAPRPVLLGNARRDVWSDPEGAFRAAQGATPIYKLYGETGLSQTKLTGFDPANDIAFWIRPGTHGIVKEDWPAFLDFVDAHVK